MFLDNNIPTVATPPPPNLDFSSADARNTVTTSPLLRQVFYIGSGQTVTSVTKSFIAPAGATRLLLGALDSGGCNHDNSGYFDVSIPVPPTPTVIRTPTATRTTPLTNTPPRTPTITPTATSTRIKLAYYALGDSVAAGHGLPGGDGQLQGTCRVSPNAYPAMVSQKLAQVPEIELSARAPFACTGAQTCVAGTVGCGPPQPPVPLPNLCHVPDPFYSNDLPGQIVDYLRDAPFRSGKKILVSLTVGADDFDFAQEAKAGTNLCRLDSAFGDGTFKRWVEQTSARVRSNVARALGTLLRDDNVYVVVTGYFNPFNEQSGYFKLLESTCAIAPWYERNPLCQLFSDRVLFSRSERAVESLNKAIMDGVTGASADPSKVRRVAFVPVSSTFEGHESPRPNCGDDPKGTDQSG
ncbi:MAG: hypothetical protein ACRD3J_18360, partial [Thermoanaerobaculia bacterium]